nr:VC0807 family protein [Nocardiopsis mwathae]
MGLAWDVGLPVAAYYGARALGCDVFVSLLAGTAAALLRVGIIAARHRRFDGFAALMVAVFATGLLLSLITGDPRMMLARESLTTAVVGTAFLGSCVVGRPLIYTIARRMNAADERKLAEWERLWSVDARFRGVFSTMSLVWGLGLVAESIVRLPLVFTLPADVMAGLSTILMVATFAALAAWTLRYARRHRPAAAEAVGPGLEENRNDVPR